MKFLVSGFLAIIYIILSPALTGQTTYLHCGKMVDSKNAKILSNKTIVVTGKRIVRIENGFTKAADTVTVIDLKDKTVLPGLIDMHVHVESETNPNAYLDTYTKNEADIALDAVAFMERTLQAGFTTVRDLGGSGVNIALKKAVAQDKIRGPRIFTAGKALASTGGHADPTNGSKQSLIGDPGPKQGVVNSIEDAKKAVRQRYKNGADCIKITATGGVLSVAKSSSNPQFSVAEIKAICETAKDYGFHVAAHAHGDEGMQRAILGGVKTIEHGTLMSEETMDLMIKNDAYLVPTITAGKEVTEKATIPNYYPAVIVPKALEIGPKIQNTFAKAYKKGVGIVFGTDAGVFEHGKNGKEFAYMHEAGMPVLEIIQSATITGAKILHQEKELGQLDQGFYADIIAVDENPVDNVRTMENVVFVMKEGVVYSSLK